jgi:hypothetical protein
VIFSHDRQVNFLDDLDRLPLPRHHFGNVLAQLAQPAAAAGQEFDAEKTIRSPAGTLARTHAPVFWWMKPYSAVVCEVGRLGGASSSMALAAYPSSYGSSRLSEWKASGQQSLDTWRSRQRHGLTRSRLIETTVLPHRGLSIGDRISLHVANIHVSADLGGAIVEDGFEVESTTRSIVYIYQDGTLRCQEVGAQKIDVPELSADARDVNLCDGHPCVVGELDPPI